MHRVGPVLAATTLAGTLVLAGCGGSDGNSGQALNGEQTKTAAQVLNDTKAALSNAKAVHVKGSLGAGADAAQIDLQLQGTDTSGTISTTGAGPLSLILTGGKAYLKAPAAYWTSSAKVSPAAAAQLGDKWVVADAAQLGSDALTLQSLAESLNTEDSPLKPDVVRGDLAGRKIVTISQQDGSTIAVANTGDPVPLTITDGAGNASQLNFTDYGKTTTITAPAGAVSADQAVAGTPAA